MGYYSDQQGIMNRYLREGAEWKGHLENTKEFIINAARGKGNNSVVIFGSGWLLDVPLEFLCKNFNSVLLVDIFHPVQVQHKIQKFKNARLIFDDITGGISKKIYHLTKNYLKTKSKIPLSDIKCDFSKFNFDCDFIVSLNILNQLDIIIIDYLKKFDIYKKFELLEFRKYIQSSHIGLLPPNRSCLITDYEESIFNDKKELEKTNPLVFTEIPGKDRSAEWQWKFDSDQTYYPGKNVVFKVIALEI